MNKFKKIFFKPLKLMLKCKCTGNVWVNHFLLFLINILIPFIVNSVYTSIVNDAYNNHFFLESITFIIWFSLCAYINYIILSVTAKVNINTKEVADKYKFWVTLLYFGLLTFVSFLAIDKLITDGKMVSFLVTISFGSLSPIATYVFKDHK